MSGALAPLAALFAGSARIAVLGVGSELRRDDFAGMYAARLLAPMACERLLVAEGSTAPENCVGLLRAFAPDAVVVLDAARMGLKPGDYALLSPERITGATFSTHMLPLPVTLSYLEAACGCQSAYVGIEPADTGQGIGMDERVSAGAQAMAEELALLLGA